MNGLYTQTIMTCPCSGRTQVPPDLAEVVSKLNQGYKKLYHSKSKSLLKKYLTRDLFHVLKVKKTVLSSNLLDVIQSGLTFYDSSIGIYAPDISAYKVFADLFDPIIEDYHQGFGKTDKHPDEDWGDLESLETNIDPTNEFIISTRIRCARSLSDYPFNPKLTEEQYLEIENKAIKALSNLDEELKGNYYPLKEMDKALQKQLINDHYLFKQGDRFLRAANACRFWPTGRGIFYNEDKTLLVWVNEEDHLRIISMQMDGNIGEVYARLIKAVTEIGKEINFARDRRLGYLTFCPTNLGTTIRASVHIKLLKLSEDEDKLNEIAEKFNLQVRGIHGEHSKSEGGVYDISNKKRLGLTEYEAVQEMYDGISNIIEIEKELQEVISDSDSKTSNSKTSNSKTSNIN